MIDFFDVSPLKEQIIFDTHAHYDDQRFSEYLDELLTGIQNHGVGGVVTCGCDGESSRNAMQLSEKYPFVYFSAGVHPGNIESGTTLSEIKKIAEHKKCVAIGEIGLDYYWVDDNKPQQKKLFEEQIVLAKELDLPVIVHDREAHSDTLEILKKYKPKGVVHSFSGSVEMAEEILKLGMYIGIGGVITFKNAKKLPEVVKMLPEDRFVLETDAPYLTPVPYRSKTNHSAMIYLTAEKIAELRNTETLKILKTTYQNAVNLFNI